MQSIESIKRRNRGEGVKDGVFNQNIVRGTEHAHTRNATEGVEEKEDKYFLLFVIMH
jgi:hypothetical protein